MTELQKLFLSDSVDQKSSAKKLIGYVPAGFPTIPGAKEIIRAMVDGGVDAIEVGFPYSDPVMDGPTIQAAADRSLANGTSSQDVMDTVQFAAELVPAVIMSYWNPIERYGADKFARDLASAGGSGAITPDLTIEEAGEWLKSCNENSLNSIFVVAPSSNDERLKKVVKNCSGFVYAASLMGVTGARAQISSAAKLLVGRLREYTDLPIAVGLGVSTPEQASEVAAYADGVIVGSAFLNAVTQVSNFEEGLKAASKLASNLKAGIS